jgi:hypothetical protein
MRIIGFAIAGLCSVYGIWIIPSWIFGWNYWDSPTYVFGDHILLPLFNSVACIVILLGKRKIGKKKMALILLMIVIPIALALFFFEPNTLLLKTEGVSNILKLYHVIFILLELSFIVFMLGVYTFLQDRRDKRMPFLFAILFILITAFVSIVLSTNELPLWKPAATLSLIFASFLFVMHLLIKHK